ncbi:cation channel sperm-associated auxiliary subunit TMEM249 [Lepisosteus oculatus]|uniref:cation channel sperm-associated auxiliary subunit TMEM249 n=1 Tax=Lepisosteus oculatus TaxID=7918 RepID=UPI0035F51B2B
MPTGIFSTWDYKIFKAEQALNSKLKKNSYHPFVLKRHNVLVMEYLHEDLWKGVLLLVASVVGNALYLSRDVKDFHQYAGYLVFCLCLALWLIASSSFRRKLVVDHTTGAYRFYIHGRLRHQGPLHQIYIRMRAQKSGQGRLLYKLILHGYKLEEQQLSGFCEKYELLEILGRRMASKLNINYFDYQDVSTRHLVNQWPKRHTIAEEKAAPV